MLFTKFFILFSSFPYFSIPYDHAAKKFQQAPPLLFGSGVITFTPFFAKSFQSLIFCGFPFLTRKTIVEVYGEELPGNLSAQPFSSKSTFSRSATSFSKANVTTSASRPSITERACDPDPPCDWIIFTSFPYFSL